MAEFFAEITETIADFICEQQVFFVATTASAGRINLSPKGVDSLRVMGPRRVAWVDLGGSGNETAAHLLHDNRVTLMLCSFAKKPLIVRLYGRGNAIQRRHGDWAEWATVFAAFPAARQFFVMEVEQAQTSCGFGVPMASEMTPRKRPKFWTESMDPEEHLERFRSRGQDTSIDGLPTGLFDDPDQ